MTRVLLALLMSTLLAPARGGAEIVDMGPHGFTSRNSVTIEAQPLQVYAWLTDAVGRWWSPDHTFSGDALNLSIDAEAGGCFCEELPNGGMVEHLTVVHSDPGRLLRLRGALGPLQSTAVTGAMSWELETSDGGSRVTVTYTVGGYVAGGLDAWSNAVDRVVGQQLERLARFVATGSSDPPPAAAGGESEPEDR